MRILSTDRLRVRELELSDAAFLLELVNDPDWLRFIGDRGVRTLDDARHYLERRIRPSYAREGFGLWLVERALDGEALGIAGLLRRETLPDVDVGFAFLARHRGQGFALEATRAVLVHGRDSLGLARIVAITLPENAASRRVLERCGLVRRGSVRLDGEDLELYANGA